MRRFASLVLVLVPGVLAAEIAGCDPGPGDPGSIVRTLSAGEMSAGLDAVAVGFDEIDREILVLDSQTRVLVFSEDATLERTHGLGSVAGRLSAIAAVPGTDEVLVTSPSTVMGYRIDLGTSEIVTTFCLLPNEQPANVEMHAFGLAYDAGSDRILTAPYWWNLDEEMVVSSSLEIYDGATGALVDWFDLEGVAAEALEVSPSGAVRILADGLLHGWNGAAGLGLAFERDLGWALGADELRSFAPDGTTGHHWLLEVDTQRIIEAR